MTSDSTENRAEESTRGGGSPQKVFVVGMDGATFDLIRPWVSEGLLPNLGRLMAEGAHGELTTTIQPLTGPAWTSFMTGMNPGKHGVFDFISRVPGTYDVRLVDSHTKRGRSLWRILSEHGRKVIVLDIPGNYPPEPVNGLLVSWMDAPGVDREFTHPPELSRQLKEALGEYVLSVNFSAPLEAHVQDIFRITDNRAAAAEYLLEKHAWDFFIVLFSGSDFAQHAFWKYMDPGHPRYDAAGAAKYGRVILDVYRRIDEHLGRLLARLDGRAAVFVVSDHGSGPLRRVVNLNRWLEERRWLAFRDNDASETGTSLTGVLRRGGVRATQALVGWAKSAPPAVKGRLKRLLPGLSGRLESRLLASTIDWPRTKAFALGAYGNIWINLRGREPAGTVEPGQEYEELRAEIAERLLELRDPETGGAVVERVYRREDLYQGPALDRAPDLVVGWMNYEYYSRQRFGERERTVFQTELTRPLSTIDMNGYHRLEGVLVMSGPGVASGRRLEGARIIDVAPTILHLLGVPVPGEMDGRVLEEALHEDFLAQHPVDRSHSDSGGGAPADSGEGVYSDEDAEKVQERLRALGYL